MNEIIKAIILGIVEGITEFLPISSTGHLIIVNEFVGFTGNFSKMFDIVIQFGAILAVVAHFFNKLMPFGNSKTALQKTETWGIWKKTMVGVIPAIFIGAVLGKRIQDKLFNPVVVALALFIGGILLVLIERGRRQNKITSISELSYSSVIYIGLFQCLAMVPGTSRSAVTIITAMLLGSSRVVAAEFSFFLAIPTIFAASAYSLLKTGLTMTSSQLLTLSVGFIVAFAIAWLVISVFMKFISKKDFRFFGYYRIVLGALVFLYFYVLK